MNLIQLSIKKPITMLMVLASLLVVGLYSYRLIAVDNMPDTNIPMVTVQVVYPGAAPDEVESAVLEKLEDEFALLEGIKKMKSTALENAGIVVLEFDQKIEANFAAIDVKDKIDRVRSNLPDAIQDPIVSKIDLNDKPIVMFSLSGGSSQLELRQLAEDFVKVQLGKISGVAAIDVLGGMEREIHIEINKSKLEGRKLHIVDVMQAIAASNLDVPLGSLTGNAKEINLKLNAKIEDLEQLKTLKIPSSSGPVELYEIAEIRDSHKELASQARYKKTAAVALNVRKTGDANVVKTANALIAAVPKIQAKLPQGYQLDVAKDQSVFIQNSVADVQSNIVMGIVLTAIILLAFLKSPAMTAIASVTMPVSLVASFSFIWGSGFSINSMTLMALGISVGILVTNSIVILENIAKYLSAGESPEIAAEKGTKEIAMAVVASTLTNLAVFIPIAFMQSLIGQFFKEFGLTIVYATVCSLFVSFTLTPMMAAKLLKPSSKKTEAEKGILVRLNKIYARSLKAAMTKKGALFTLSLIALLFASLFWVGPQLGSTFTPKTDEGLLEVTLEMPSGTNLKTTSEATQIAEKIIGQTEGVESYLATIGGVSGSKDGKSVSRISVRMKPKSERSVRTQDVVEKLRAELTEIPDAKVSVVLSSSMAGDPNASDLDIEITGMDFNEITQVTDSLIPYIKSLNMVGAVRSSWKAGKPERIYTPDRQALADYALTAGQVGQAVRAYVYGYEASVYREKNEEYPILVRFREEDRSKPSDVMGAMVVSPKAGPIPLSALVHEKMAAGPSVIERKDKERMIYVRNYLLPGVASSDLQKKVAEWAQEHTKNTGVKVGFGGNTERMGEAVVDFGVAIIMAILLTYILLTALLESYVQPLLIMSTLPLGLVGVVWSLFITGKDISIIALMAVVMLIGIVVNNAILIMDEANQMVRGQGVSPAVAIYESSVAKFRAILMTNAATILAMVPLALGLGEGAEFRQPMAITAIGGLIVSTVLTVYLVPILYKLTGKKG